MRSYLRFASVIGAVTLGAIAAAPAMAAAPISQAGANAVTVVRRRQRAGHRQRHRHQRRHEETKTGETAPAVPVPRAAGFFTGGVLAQEATATAAGGTGPPPPVPGSPATADRSLNIGESQLPRPPATRSPARFGPRLQRVALIDTDSPRARRVTGPLAPVTGVLDQVTDGRRRGARGHRRPVRRHGPGLQPRSVVGRTCTAGPGTASGIGHHRRRRHPVSGGGQDITLLDLPVNPPPNTHLVTEPEQGRSPRSSPALRTNLNTRSTASAAARCALLRPTRPEPGRRHRRRPRSRASSLRSSRTSSTSP